MYLNCGVFQKSRRARPDMEQNEDSNCVTTSPRKKSSISEDMGETSNKRENNVSYLKLGDTPAKVEDTFFCESDWSQLEGVYFKDLLGVSGKEQTAYFLKSLCEILTSYVLSESDSSTKVLDFHHPHQLKEMMSHCLDIHPEPGDLEQVLSDCRETLKYCVKTGHPHFFNQLSTGIDVVGMAGAWLSSCSNTNMFTYEVAPVFTLMEEVILNRMRHLIGWSDGDAIFAPGGAISNLYGVLVARHRVLPEAKQIGMMGLGRTVLLTSEQSHFSIKRAAAMLGIGINNVLEVKCHYNGKMDVDDLRDKILSAERSGAKVIMVNATCGTTVLGAYDPVCDIADICEEHDIWLHIDAAWGGGAFLSRDHKYLLNGTQRADSLTWNPHKMMGVPLQCSAFLSKHRGVLKTCNGLGATYLFQKDKHYDVSYDTGDLSIQCGRHNDIFKLWLMWRAKGDIGFEEQINKHFKLAGYLRDKVKARDGFHLILDKIEGPNVCFWYLPPSWRTRPLEKIKEAHLHKVAPLIKAKMMEAGSLMVQYQPLGHLPNLFRVAISNPVLTKCDLDYLLDEIDKLGQEIPTPLDWDER